MKFPSRKKYTVKKTKKATAKKRVAKPSKKFAKAVQKVIHANAETKMATVQQAFTSFNSAISVAGDIYPIIPAINQGIQDNNRLGDQCRGQKIRLRGHLIMAQNYNTGVSNCRIAVRLMVVQPKAYATLDTVQANYATWMPSLLKRGGTSVAFTGLISDLYSDVNTDAITCYYDKIIYMTLPHENRITGTTNVNTVGVSDLRQTVKFFDLTRSLRNKLLKYDPAFTSGQQPSNFSPVLVVGYAHLDGSSPDTVDTQVSIQFNSNLYFEDM